MFAPFFKAFTILPPFADRRMDKNVSTKVLVDHVGIEEIGENIILTVSGSHFLWKMVRRIAGILVEVGRGNLSERDILAFLNGPSELPAQHTAPPSGLFLAQILYDGDVEEPVRLPLCRDYGPAGRD